MWGQDAQPSRTDWASEHQAHSKGCTSLWAFLAPRSSSTMSLLERHLPGSFRGMVLLSKASSSPGEQHSLPKPSLASWQTCCPHHPGEQGDENRVPAALGSTARTEGWRPPREGTSAGSLCQHPGLLQPPHERPRLLSNSTNTSPMLPWLVNPDKPHCLSLFLTALEIAFVSSKGGQGKKNPKQSSALIFLGLLRRAC